MLNLIVNIIFGYGLETLYFGYAFNKIKGNNYKSTYMLFLISYIISSICASFSFINHYYVYILVAFVFYILYAIIHKEYKQITNFFLMLNILLFSSIITAIPIIFIGYNQYYLIINIIINLLLLLILKLLPVNKYYKFIISNWNRTAHNKIKSVTIRNFTMIIICILVTLINLFINNIFMGMYTNIL